VAGDGLQSISASDLLKEQKKKQQELLESRRRRRADEIQKLALQNSSAGGPSLSPTVPGSSPRVTGSSPRVPGSSPRVPGSSPRVPASRGPAGPLLSPRAACEVPKGPAQSSPAPRGPTLGRGFSEGEDILFFDHSPPQARPPAPSLSAAKMAALRKLKAKAKGAGLAKEDPNAVKRKRSGGDGGEISARVEKNLAAVQGGTWYTHTHTHAHTRTRTHISILLFLRVLISLDAPVQVSRPTQRGRRRGRHRSGGGTSATSNQRSSRRSSRPSHGTRPRCRR